MEHDQSVEFYTEALVKMRIYFPHGRVDCRHCRFCGYREPFNLYQCKLTEAYMEKSELDERNIFCPIEIQEAPF